MYGLFPLFGPFRGAIAIIQSGHLYLVLDRSDGLGLCFPGGLAHWREMSLETARRELLEETGLDLISAERLFEYESDVDVPAITTVFRGVARGQLRESWEGTPRWISLQEMEPNKIFSAHAPVIEYLKRIGAPQKRSQSPLTN